MHPFALAALALLAAAPPDDAEQRASGPHARDAALHAGAPDADWTRWPEPQETLLAPAASAPQLTARVYGYLPYWSTIGADFRWDLVSDLVLFSADLKADGTFSSWHGFPQTALIQTAHAHGVRVHLCATLFNSSTGGEIAAFLASATARSAAITALVNALKSAGADGLDYDFEFVPTASKDAFSQFVEDSHAALVAAIPGAELTLATPSSVGYHGYDFARLGKATERILIMAYDYHWTSAPNTGPVAPLTKGSFWGSSTSTDIAGVLAVTDAAGLAMGVPYYGNDWPAASDQRNAATSGSATAVLAKNAIPDAAAKGRIWDADSQTPWYRYQSGGAWHQAWYDDGESLAAKYSWAKSKSLAGIMIWALGYDAGRTELWDALQAAYGITTPPPGPGSLSITQVDFSPATLASGDELTVTFTVKNTGGQAVSAVAPPPGTLYDEAQQATGPVAGSFRLAVDIGDRPATQLDHPWRWGLQAPLAAGASATVTGTVTLREPGTRTVWAAVIQEGTGAIQDDVGRTQVVVTGVATDAGSGADAGADAGSGADAGTTADAGATADAGGGAGGDGTQTIAPAGGCAGAGAPGLGLLVLLAAALRRRARG